MRPCTKFLFPLILCLLTLAVYPFADSAAAAVPSTMTVQGQLTDGLGSPLPAGAKSFTFKIYDAATGGTEIWPGETQSIATDDEGRWTAEVGANSSLSAIIFADTARWLEIAIDDGVNPVTTLPRVNLNTAPYAFQADQAVYADTAEYVLGGSSGGDDDWQVVDSIVQTQKYVGIARGAAGNQHIGDSAHTTVNLGVGSITAARYATVGGGRQNFARGAYSVVAGGGGNGALDSNSATGYASVIGGGAQNICGNIYATVAGGAANDASGISSVISGGTSNVASNTLSTISGGTGNEATGFQSIIAGGRLNTAQGTGSVISGGEFNFADDSMSVIGGGRQNRVYGAFSVVAGGGGHGIEDSNSAMGPYSTIGGGRRNTTGHGSTVAGGTLNHASGLYNTVGGGYSNQATDTISTVAGGFFNEASGFIATVAGGSQNRAEDSLATVGGGNGNIASGAYSVVAGGGGPISNLYNTASGQSSVIGGGRYNLASGSAATVPGGDRNEARGDYSLAAGFRATIDSAHAGSFLWSDAEGFDFQSVSANEFAVRATGGARIVVAIDGSGNPTWTAELVDGASWAYTSDSTLKENFTPVNGSAVLDQLARIPISRWNAKSQDASVQHIGPTAQDFFAAFGLGTNERLITSSDAHGIALAAIQELDRRTRRIDQLESDVAELRRLVQKLSNRIE